MTIISLEKMKNHKEKFINNDQRQMMMRGKRTKRSRSRSRLQSGCSGGSDENDNDHVYLSTPSEKSACTEEDEDMANCLILLAQSGGYIEKQQHTKAEEKIATTTTTTNDKTGFCVYECKTCNRNFASFQALGGHRASHKKPKVITMHEKKIVLPSNNNNINEGEFVSYVEREKEQLVKMMCSSLSIHKPLKYDNEPKVHECSICGSEFSSGQALGGHMRRHRSVTTTNNNSNINVEENYESKPRNILLLDLNLPAPEDDHRDTKFPFVFAAPSLVGCHY